MFTPIFFVITAIIGFVFYKLTPPGLVRVVFIILAVLIAIAVVRVAFLHLSLV